MGAGGSGSGMAATLVSSPTGLASAVSKGCRVRERAVSSKPVKVRWTLPREWMRSTISWPR
jgi:hypothetical protein